MKTSPFALACDLRDLSTSSDKFVAFEVIGDGAENEI